VYSPSISLLPSNSRNIMFRKPPDLFRDPLIVSLRLVRNGTRPENTLDICEGRGLDVRSPSLSEEWMSYFRERLAFCGDENCAKNVIAVFKIFGGEMIDPGGAYIQLKENENGNTFDASCCNMLECNCLNLWFSSECMFEFKSDLY
jgi:hypothetical protein